MFLQSKTASDAFIYLFICIIHFSQQIIHFSSLNGSFMLIGDTAHFLDSFNFFFLTIN